MNDIIKVENGVIELTEQAMAKMARAQELLAEAKVYEDEFKTALTKAMEDNGIKKFENDLLSAVFIPETVAVTFDSKRLKEEAPDVFEAYKKETKRKSYVKISYK